MKNTFLFFGLLFFLFPAAGASSGTSWKTEFEAICVHTIEAPGLSTERVRELVDESDRLMKTIEKVNDPRKKVYLFRLKKCRNFFQYILESRAAEDSEGAESLTGDEQPPLPHRQSNGPEERSGRGK